MPQFVVTSNKSSMDSLGRLEIFWSCEWILFGIAIKCVRSHVALSEQTIVSSLSLSLFCLSFTVAVNVSHQTVVDVIDQSTKEHVTESLLKRCEAVDAPQEVKQLGSNKEYENDEVGDIFVTGQHVVDVQQKQYWRHKRRFCWAKYNSVIQTHCHSWPHDYSGSITGNTYLRSDSEAHVWPKTVIAWLKTYLSEWFHCTVDNINTRTITCGPTVCPINSISV